MPELQSAETEEKERFEITDESTLHWTFRKMRELRGKIVEKEELAKADYARIDEERKLVDVWLDNETRSFSQSIEHFDHLIREYHLALLNEDGTQKTLSTPFGKSKTTTTAEQPDKGDEEKLLKYAKDNKLTDLIKVEETIRWGDLKKTLKVVDGKVIDENGEIVEGAKVKPQTVTCKVELS